jgi:hypothetical protein
VSASSLDVVSGSPLPSISVNAASAVLFSR